MAHRLSIVSSSDSPFDVDEVPMFRLITSADSRLAAISKVVRVRVELSKNRLNTDLPRSRGIFFTSRSATSVKGSAMSRMARRMSRGSPSMVSRCCSSPFLLSWGLCIDHPEREHPGGILFQLQVPVGRHVHDAGAIARTDRQLAPAAIDQYRQIDARRPAVVEQLVHGRAYGSPRVEDVVDDDDGSVRDVEGNLRRAYLRMQAAAMNVVAIEGRVYRSERNVHAQCGVYAPCQPDSAGVYADQGSIRPDLRADLPDQVAAKVFCIRKRHRSSSAK